jgi:hypothetical protein
MIQKVTLLSNILRFGLETGESGSGSRSSDEVDRQAPAEPLDLSTIPDIVLTPYNKTKTTESLAQQAAPTAATADTTPTATAATAATPGTEAFTAVAAAAATAIAATAKTATFTAVTAAAASATAEVRAAVPGRNDKVWNEPTYPVGEVCFGDLNSWISSGMV